MIVVRNVFQAKIGRASELAQGMAESMRRTPPAGAAAAGWRVLTDLSGPFDTVVLEIEVESLAAWEEGTPYAWGGAESRAMTATRRFLRQERGLAREQVSMVAYWLHPQSPADAGD